jgi:hypothetical protein
MSTRLAIAAAIAVAGIVLAACTVGSVPTPLPTLTPTAPPTQAITESPETPGPSVDPLLVSSFCDPFATEVLPAWPPTDAAAADALDVSFRVWRDNPMLAALADDMKAVLAYLAVARTSSRPVSPTTDAAEAFASIEAFAAENC